MMMIHKERARQEGMDSRQICGRNTKCLVLKANVTAFITGFSCIVETQDEIVAAAAESNLRRQTQTSGTTFCLPLLVAAFGACANNEANCNDVIAGTFISPEGSDPFTVPLLQALEQPTSLSDKGLIDYTITPAAHS